MGSPIYLTVNNSIISMRMQSTLTDVSDVLELLIRPMVFVPCGFHGYRLASGQVPSGYLRVSSNDNDFTLDSALRTTIVVYALVSGSFDASYFGGVSLVIARETCGRAPPRKISAPLVVVLVEIRLSSSLL